MDELLVCGKWIPHWNIRKKCQELMPYQQGRLRFKSITGKKKTMKLVLYSTITRTDRQDRHTYRFIYVSFLQS